MKHFFWIVGLVLMSHALIAQTALTIKAGPSFATFSGSGSRHLVTGMGTLDGKTKIVTGLAAGVGANILVTPFLSVNPELLFVQTGGEFAASEGSQYKLRFNSIQLPVLSRVQLGGEEWQAYLNVGPFVSCNLTAMRSYSPATGMSADMDAGFGTAHLSRWDLGYAMGLGFAYELGPGKIGVDVRYQQGFVSVQNVDAGSGDVGYEGKTYNRIFMPTLFYAYRIGLGPGPKRDIMSQPKE